MNTHFLRFWTSEWELFYDALFKEGPFRASNKGGTLTKDPLTGPQLDLNGWLEDRNLEYIQLSLRKANYMT